MNRSYQLASLGIVLMTVIGSLLVYPNLPDQIPTHWNYKNEIDGYGSKTWAVLLLPLVMMGMWLLFRFLPWLSPKQFTLDSFRNTYGYTVIIVLLLMAYMHAMVLVAGQYQKLDLGRALIAGLGLFFVLLGNVLGKVRRNFYVGIRTPWTLASERVWNDTHRLAAWLFVAGGLASFVVVFTPLNPLIAVPIILFPALATVLYSLVHYKKLEKRGEM